MSYLEREGVGEDRGDQSTKTSDGSLALLFLLRTCRSGPVQSAQLSSLRSACRTNLSSFVVGMSGGKIMLSKKCVFSGILLEASQHAAND